MLARVALSSCEASPTPARIEPSSSAASLVERVDVAEQAPDLGLVVLQDVVERAHHRGARLQEVADDVLVVAEQAR